MILTTAIWLLGGLNSVVLWRRDKKEAFSLGWAAVLMISWPVITLLALASTVILTIKGEVKWN